ncbi:MAG: proton-conducting transporter membrane subunit [Anaerolineales bacterium]
MPTLPVVFSWALLLIGVLLQLIFTRILSNRAKGWLAFLTSLSALISVLTLWRTILSHQTIDFRLLAWDGPASLSYHADGLGFFFALIATAVGTIILLYSIDYMENDPSCTRFYALMLTFIAGLVHLVFTSDLFLLYLSWEVIGLCSFLLVGFWYGQAEASRGARKVFVMTHIAGYGLLAMVLTLYARSGSTLWTEKSIAASLNLTLLTLAFIAAMAKSVQFPLHTWIPDAMAAPTPVSALLHAACYVTAGVYLMARLRGIAPWPAAFESLVILVALLTMFIGAMFAMLQTDLKRLLAFSTVSQVGYMMLGIGIGTPLGIAAGLLLCLNHALFKAGLFLCAGKIQHETGTRNLDILGGLSRWMPHTTLFWLLLAGSISGLPLLSGFVSKWLLYHAALEADQSLAVLVSWLVSVVTVFYFLKASNSIFFGAAITVPHTQKEKQDWMQVGIGSLAIGSVVLGIAPQLAISGLINPLLTSLGQAPLSGISWLGITMDGGSWFSSLGLGLAFLAILIGLVIYLIFSPYHKLAIVTSNEVGEINSVFSGGEPLPTGNRLTASDFANMLRLQLNGFYAVSDADRAYRYIWRALNWLGVKLNDINSFLEKHSIFWLTLFGMLTGLSVLFFPNSSFYTTKVIQPNSILLIGVAISLLCLAGLSFTFSLPNQSRWLLILSGIFLLLGLLSKSEIGHVILLEFGALLAVILVWRTSSQKRIRTLYLFVFLLSALCSLLVSLTGDHLSPALVRFIWIIGIGIKLAIIPLYLWLPMVAEALPAIVVGFLISIVDMAAFGEMIALRQTAAWLFTPTIQWLIYASSSCLCGAILMLSQKDLKRLLAFSSIEDMGYLTLAVILSETIGMQAAVIGAVVHTLAKVLLFSSLASIESDMGFIPNRGGMAQKFPLSGAAFLIGMISILGVPPSLGYIARWRIYYLGLAASPWLLGLLLISSAIALLAYGQALVTFWWGTDNIAINSENDSTKTKSETLTFKLIVWLIAFLLLAGGLLPFILQRYSFY